MSGCTSLLKLWGPLPEEFEARGLSTTPRKTEQNMLRRLEQLFAEWIDQIKSKLSTWQLNPNTCNQSPKQNSSSGKSKEPKKTKSQVQGQSFPLQSLVFQGPAPPKSRRSRRLRGTARCGLGSLAAAAQANCAKGSHSWQRASTQGVGRRVEGKKQTCHSAF